MASVEQVRNGISLATEKAQESIGALQQAATALEQAQNALHQVTQGSSQADAEQAANLLSQAVSSIGETQNQVQSAISTAEGYANRL
ncbi:MULTISPECIES: hypothetical protein [unclassified Crossiella]|uniref:hypothetical protein n=1 Tax=unclassified Crossiella TaxID=2620835 RepID=UPI001FFEA8C2|nr:MULTISPECIES: hypothetical protein [unclassified Crossiella]MCK2238026.1 hypothetical protein [Crossiella sp. S99.2]MCK2255309.1 hypothetical protein [Crossiella sp. S99.1]